MKGDPIERRFRRVCPVHGKPLTFGEREDVADCPRGHRTRWWDVLDVVKGCIVDRGGDVPRHLLEVA